MSIDLIFATTLSAVLCIGIDTPSPPMDKYIIITITITIGVLYEHLCSINPAHLAATNHFFPQSTIKPQDLSN
jgi:hypothetical protein